jgi:hypothetical protein
MAIATSSILGIETRYWSVQQQLPHVAQQYLPFQRQHHLVSVSAAAVCGSVRHARSSSTAGHKCNCTIISWYRADAVRVYPAVVVCHGHRGCQLSCELHHRQWMTAFIGFFMFLTCLRQLRLFRIIPDYLLCDGINQKSICRVQMRGFFFKPEHNSIMWAFASTAEPHN